MELTPIELERIPEMLRRHMKEWEIERKILLGELPMPEPQPFRIPIRFVRFTYGEEPLDAT